MSSQLQNIQPKEVLRGDGCEMGWDEIWEG